MFKKVLKEITHITENDSDNTENYLDALNYLDNIYKLIIHMQEVISVNDFDFLPSFKGRYLVERLGIPSTAEENELRLFKMQSEYFRDSLIVSKLKKSCEEVCESFENDDNVIVAVLR